MNYFVVGSHPWNKEIFDARLKHLPGDWYYFDDFDALELAFQDIHDGPEYIFFLHWSKKVPSYLIEQANCVCFHPTKLPYGRGGTPIQNLIMESAKSTYLTTFKMTDEIDAGPIYIQLPFSLEGSLHDIFRREMDVAADMIWKFVYREIEPVPQEGEPTYFYRRKPEESEMDSPYSPITVYNFIRMLDAEDYPKAFLDFGILHLEFSDAQLLDDKVVAKVEITCKK